MNQEHFSAVIAAIEIHTGRPPEALRITMRNKEIYEGAWSYLDNQTEVITIDHITRFGNHVDAQARRVYIALPAIATVSEPATVPPI